MLWVEAATGDFSGIPPSPRSGHTAVKVGKSLILVFGGLVDKKFLNDLIVFDIDNKVWFEPKCSGVDGHLGPIPRAFHVAVTIDCHMFIFGGRSGRKRLGDFWMLDTDIWQWTELTGFGDLPSARDFAAGASVGNGRVVLYGGWDGSKWLSDVYVLDTISLEWRQLAVTGPMPPPRCGHTATMVEKRLLIFGGRGGGGPIIGDLWALKGLFDEENAGWTQLKLPGQAPSPRCGHTVTSGGTQLLVFGGHGTGGWLTRYDIYFNDCIILDRASVQWKRLPVNNQPPSSRAYHSMTRIASRFLLIGGYDGKNTFGDLWWLVSEDDPTAKRALLSQIQTDVTPSKEKTLDSSSIPSKAGEQEKFSPLAELRRRLGLPAVSTVSIDKDEDSDQLDKELVALGSELIGRETTGLEDPNIFVQSIRDHWNSCDPRSIQLKELGALLRDYQRLVADLHWQDWKKGLAIKVQRFYHLKNAGQLNIDDIPALLSEYRQLRLQSGSEL